MIDRPTIEDAPGLQWKRLKSGWEARWHARTDLAKRGFEPKTRALWTGEELDGATRAMIQDQCKLLQSEMLIWGRGGIVVASPFDGTMKSLIQCYQIDPDSSYQTVRYGTRTGYDSLLKRIIRDHGADVVAIVRARDLKAWHREWSASGVPMAHHLIGMLRSLFSFGKTLLEDKDCARLSDALHKFRFKGGKAREEQITAEQATAVRAMAHQMGRPSIALAQALQFDLMLRQKDVIGEWVPLGEAGTTDVHSGQSKWLHGLRWSEIDGDLILRHTTSKRDKGIEVNLRLAPMVMEELTLLGERPTSGPLIVSEVTSQPYFDHNFRKKWRMCASACGVPENVFNMDSRAGAITEATDAGAQLEDVRHAATHSNVSMTARYSRGATEKTAKVMQRRSDHRTTKNEK